jgi:molybdopterin-binding protein
MTLSARNQFKGIVEEIQLGGVMAHVVVRVGDNLVESVITRRSAEVMSLKKGDTVKVLIKSTEVMLQKDGRRGCQSLRPHDGDAGHHPHPSRLTFIARHHQPQGAFFHAQRSAVGAFHHNDLGVAEIRIELCE